MLVAIAGALVIVVSLGVGVLFWPGARDDLDVEQLLVPDAVWLEVAPEVEIQKNERFDLPKDGGPIKIRRWTDSKTETAVRQEVFRSRNGNSARLRYYVEDPEPTYRGKFPSVTATDLSLSTADSAKSVCVHTEAADCWMIEYWLRYDRFLVKLILLRDDGLSERGLPASLLSGVEKYMSPQLD
ncbi:hypothetical protein OG792_24815 [Micromonospora sp. NBC_01699]|uniref:hypothetical protein n=1 Tax=Micromonospora sp. NBC_01699 TaxID=2975984 RepID=UPI002E2C7C65|nr:hypothetical protein [Micromonospora sp. NBC_01699]